MRSAVLALAVLAVAAPALGRDKPVPAATPTGKPVDCIRLNDIRESRVRSDEVIDFVTKSNKVYRNALDGGCPQLGFERRFSYQVSTGQLCSTDIITVLTGPGITRGASCGLGRFQPVELAKTAR
ncbi:hypothetical protein [Sphingomonas sp. DT-204]|uniref:hypothetical protein n=1 Tax=Sphingomonas sp. DT-204 TaxID=3396166 RepID=UPI003F19F7A6